MSYSSEYDIGGLKADVVNLKLQVESLSRKIDTLTEAMQQAKGGWFVFTLIGSGLMFAIMNFIIPYFKG